MFFMNLSRIQSELRRLADPATARVLRGFFKTGPGQYAEGDVFIGVKIPPLRKLSLQGDGLTPAELRRLLQSRIHEERLLALMLLVRRFERGDDTVRKQVFDLYWRESSRVNNWDLVDLSAHRILGAWLLERPRGLLKKMARSPDLWERRRAVVATQAFIRVGQYRDTLELCRILLNDPQDLLHKACGWMLREVGKKDRKVLDGFLDRQAAIMPRTMLRYAIERHPEARRHHYLKSGK